MQMSEIKVPSYCFSYCMPWSGFKPLGWGLSEQQVVRNKGVYTQYKTYTMQVLASYVLLHSQLLLKPDVHVSFVLQLLLGWLP
jgi:hypothetical protein